MFIFACPTPEPAIPERRNSVDGQPSPDSPVSNNVGFEGVVSRVLWRRQRGLRQVHRRASGAQAVLEGDDMGGFADIVGCKGSTYVLLSGGCCLLRSVSLCSPGGRSSGYQDRVRRRAVSWVGLRRGGVMSHPARVES